MTMYGSGRFRLVSYRDDEFLPEHEGAALERKRVGAKPDQLRQLLAL